MRWRQHAHHSNTEAKRNCAKNCAFLLFFGRLFNLLHRNQDAMRKRKKNTKRKENIVIYLHQKTFNLLLCVVNELKAIFGRLSLLDFLRIRDSIIFCSFCCGPAQDAIELMAHFKFHVQQLLLRWFRIRN